MSNDADDTTERAATMALRMEQLRTEYRASLPERATKIKSHWSQYCAEGILQAGLDARDLVHRLAGTASLFGMAELGLAAQSAETEMQHALDGSKSGDDGVWRLLDLMEPEGSAPRPDRT